MSGLITAIPTGIGAFSGTNIDDLAILRLFFSQVGAGFRRRHTVAGQYLGFAARVAASLPSFFGGLILPPRWIGLLGLVPGTFRLSRLLNPDSRAEEVAQEAEQSERV
ncbi:cadmium resistance transporter [Kamptonema formosum]|uniref:cadmium resistance transporter n=1 Tax=Kamptonema formosum TaxID=331992 RepID=UPI0003462827|nr:cadmium resistance transporter [Oscillatoria sp. PCC 10802]